jgi:hypothetical protein
VPNSLRLALDYSHFFVATTSVRRIILFRQSLRASEDSMRKEETGATL